MRIRGINVIHGGENSLRYTPHFRLTSEEIQRVRRLTSELAQNLYPVETW